MAAITESRTEVVSEPPKWQILLRQNSEKMGKFAEEVVLPKNQRSTQPTSRIGDVALRDMEAFRAHTPTQMSSPIQRRYFPVFMLGISSIQVILMYSVPAEILLIVFGYDPHRRHEIWRFVTMMLAHLGLSHLWWNVFFQMILGVLLEIVHQWKRISIIYLASVFGGSLFISVLSPDSYVVGASAGVYGLLFSHLSTIVLNWNEMDRKCCRLFWLLFYITFDIGLNIFAELSDNTTLNVSHAGHIGGAITGFLVSILVLKNFTTHPWEEKMQKICVGTLIAIFAIIFTINVTVWSLYLPTAWNFNYTSTYEHYVVKMLIESGENSTIYKECNRDPECKRFLDTYKFNGTILS